MQSYIIVLLFGNVGIYYLVTQKYNFIKLKLKIYREYYTVARTYEVYFRVEKRSHSFATLTREIFFPREDRLHMFKPTCSFFLLHRYECFQNKK